MRISDWSSDVCSSDLCGFRLIDSQSGQRLYQRAVYTLDDVPGEGFVFEAQMLISAARSAGAGVVAVPIETRYATANHPAQFRKSHFRLVRDLWQITSHGVGPVLGNGALIADGKSVVRGTSVSVQV